MANAIDSEIVLRLHKVEHLPERLITELEAVAPEIQDDSVYWLMVLTSWVKNGTQAVQDRYRVLMQSKRRNRIRAMKRSSLAIWRALPDPVIAHRLVAPGEDVDRAMSWSLDIASIERYMHGRELHTRAFPKSVVPFYTDRRAEREIVVLDAAAGTVLPPGTPTNAKGTLTTSRSPGRAG